MQLELDQLKCCVDHLRVFETEFCLCRGRLPAEPEHPRKREDDVEEQKGNFLVESVQPTCLMIEKKYQQKRSKRKSANFQSPERRVEGTRMRTLNQNCALPDMNYH